MGHHGVGSNAGINDYLLSEEEEKHHEQDLVKGEPDKQLPSKELEVADAGQSGGQSNGTAVKVIMPAAHVIH